MLLFSVNQVLKLHIWSLDSSNDFRDWCVFLDIFLVIGFALPEISSFEEFSHFLIYIPELGVWPAFHLLAVEFQEGNVSRLLNHRPFSIFREAFEIAGTISRDAEGSTWDFWAHGDVFVDFKQYLRAKCGHFFCNVFYYSNGNIQRIKRGNANNIFISNLRVSAQ